MNKIFKLNDSNFMMHLLLMCPAKWQRQYDLMENLVNTKVLLLVFENIKSNVEIDDKPPSNNKAKKADAKRKGESNNSQIPKKAKKGWTKKHCIHCKKHGGIHTTHNMKECHHFNNNGTPKKVGGTPRPQKKESGKDGTNFAQIIHLECKKVLHTTLNKSNCRTLQPSLQK